jgi:nucleoside phosphorylase
MSGPLLFIAADPREFAGFLPRWQQAQPLQLAVHWARNGRWKGREVIGIANGAGADRAFAAALLAPKPSAICNIGFCGALDDTLHLADIVIGTAVRSEGDSWFTAAFHSPVARKGVVASIDHIAQTSAEKRNLRATGASIVEMEAVGVARAAEDLGLPFYCVRAVSDLASEDFAHDFNAALKADGRFSALHLIRQGHFGELLQLQRRTADAAKKLGDFLNESSF